MKRNSDSAERRKATENLKKARKALHGYFPPDGTEDDTYTRLNSDVIEAEKAVSWWRR